MEKKIDRNYLYDNTIRDAEDMLVGGIQLIKTDNLKVKKRLNDNTIIYYIKGGAKKSNIHVKNKRARKVAKTRIRKRAK